MVKRENGTCLMTPSYIVLIRRNQRLDGSQICFLRFEGKAYMKQKPQNYVGKKLKTSKFRDFFLGR
jgi:hypothetical protein